MKSVLVVAFAVPFSWAAAFVGVTSGTWSYSGVPDPWPSARRFRFYTRARDGAGNICEPVTREFTVANAAAEDPAD